MSPAPIRVLAVDDEPDLCALTKQFLEISNVLQVDIAGSAEEAVSALKKLHYDAIVSDYQMPGEDGIALLKRLRRNNNDIPFILFTGRGREEVVIEALNSGADFYLQKGGNPKAQFHELEHKIREAVRRSRAEQALRENEARLVRAQAIGLAGCWEFRGDPNNGQYWGSDEFFRIFGIPVPPDGEIPMETIEACMLDVKRVRQARLGLIEKGEEYDLEYEIAPADGGPHRFIHSMAKRVKLSQPQSPMIEGVIQDITERKRATLTMKQDLAAMESSIDGIAILDPEGKYVFTNQAHAEIYGYDSPEDLIGKSWRILYDQQELDVFEKYHMPRLSQSGSWRGDSVGLRRDGSKFVQEVSLTQLEDGGLICVVRDTSETARNKETLRQKTALFEAQVASSIDGILVIDQDFKRILVNQRIVELFDVPKNIMDNENDSHLLEHVVGLTKNPEQFLRNVNYLNDHVNEISRDEIEFKNGMILDRYSAPVLGKNGEYYGRTWTFRDITEQKKIESDLRRSEEKYRLITDHIADVVTVMDLELRFNYVSPSIAGLRGFTAEEAMEQSLDQILTPGSIRLVLKTLNEEMERQASGEIGPDHVLYLELEEYRKDGTIIWVGNKLSFIPDENGQPKEIVALSYDITERKLAEETLQEAQTELRVAMDLARLGHWEYAVDADTFTFDDQFYSLYGTTAVKEGGTKMSPAEYAKRFLPTEEAPIVGGEIEGAKLTKDPGFWKRIEHDIIRRDGERRTIAVVIRVIIDPSGRVIKIYGVNQDITEQKRGEEALKQANRKLNLLSSITRHDINNQTTSLEGYLALLEMGHPQLASDEHLKKVKTTARRISEMIRFTKEYQDIGVRSPTWDNVRSLIEKCSKNVHFGTIVLVNDIPADLEMFADPLITKVFFNLMDNAVRYGNRITTIRFYLEEQNDVRSIVCEDDGAGISKELRNRLFTSSVGKYHGFGLFLSKEILSITGITITEEGEQGIGAKFVMTVPRGGTRRPLKPAGSIGSVA